MLYQLHNEAFPNVGMKISDFIEVLNFLRLYDFNKLLNSSCVLKYGHFQLTGCVHSQSVRIRGDGVNIYIFHTSHVLFKHSNYEQDSPANLESTIGYLLVGCCH